MSREELKERASRIRLLVLDVDGVLTDGSVYLDDRGVETKRFCVRDGFAIKSWQRAGREIAVITGRQADGVAIRCRNLGIVRITQSSPWKARAFKRVLHETGMSAEETCCLGDDLPELPLMMSCGLGIAVADADPAVRTRAHWVTRHRGGRGAVRESIELLLKAQGIWEEVLSHYARAIE